MRPSNRSRILEAAIRVIQRDGVTGVTFDAVAAEAGVTRGGMMYHFPSREALLKAIHQQLADQWEAALEASAGKPVKDTTAEERIAAYAITSAQSATRSELLFLLHSSADDNNSAPWDVVAERWAPRPPSDADDVQAMSLFIARLAADGLWVHEALTNTPLPPKVRERVVRELSNVLGVAPGEAATDTAARRGRPVR